ncbi:MAG: FdtA/QdtA family cupin domain-containing protein [Acidimicrobiales bacterium]|nr:FdtA/QdtA family cupin domain-containing protein [Acidimicrobiales bacterium]
MDPVSAPDLLGCRLVALDRHGGPRGTLTVVIGEGGGIRAAERGFLLTDVPPGGVRGGHAHRRSHQLVVVAAGEVDATVADGVGEAVVRLVAGGEALAVPPLVWLTLSGFTPGAAVLVLGTEPHDDAEFVRSLDELRRLRTRP